MNLNAKKITGPRSVGRPRILDRKSIITAAFDIGIDKITMKRLADQLGVGVATLYKYVDSREELIRLVADEMMGRVKLPNGGDLSWEDYARQYCAVMQRSLVEQPSVIAQLLNGGFGVAVSAKLVEGFVAAVVNAGFPELRAIPLYRTICQISVGGAIAELEFQQQKRFDHDRIEDTFHVNQDSGVSDASMSNLLLDALISEYRKDG